MLEKINLERSVQKAEYQKAIGVLELKIGEMQREARKCEIPIVVAFEGWDAAGKGTLINSLMMTMDPRGFKVYSANAPTEEERLRSFLWRFWTKTPSKGRIAIFDRSWYGRVLGERVEKIIKKKQWQAAYGQINVFERQLADSGCVILKFFLHISKKEQKKRFKKLLADPGTAWKVTKEDRRRHKQYGKYFQAAQDMFAKTNTAAAPWTIVEAHDKRYAALKVFKIFASTVEKKIAEFKRASKAVSLSKKKNFQTKPGIPSVLDNTDLSKSLSRQEYEPLLKKYQKELRECEFAIYKKRIPVILVFQGWDGAGKGGNIKRLIRGLDPRGYDVVPVCAPTDTEKSHHYLWRFWQNIPKAGHITIFDRSWYGRVLDERVEGFCKEEEWKRAYREINEMEEQLSGSGCLIIKFWLHIDKEEQLRRFKLREKIPYKQWKITQEDWRNRGNWDRYKEAVDEMLFRTSTLHAPWTVVEANCKFFARIKTLEKVTRAIEERLK